MTYVLVGGAARSNVAARALVKKRDGQDRNHDAVEAEDRAVTAVAARDLLVLTALLGSSGGADAVSLGAASVGGGVGSGEAGDEEGSNGEELHFDCWFLGVFGWFG